MEDVNEGRNENSVKYFDEHRQNYPVNSLAKIKGQATLTGADLKLL